MDFDGRRPVRTTLRLLAPGRWRLVLATAAFAVKDSPIWLLPLLTANIIDVVVEHRPIVQLWLNAAVLAVILLQNIPMHMLWVRQLSRIVRQLGTDLRSDLAGRLQQLSISFHTKAGASLLQTKVVRDVENVELMLQQVAASGTSAVLTLLGALSLTAVRVPQFVPLFLLVVPCTAALVAMVRRRSGARNAEFRRRVEDLSARVDEMAHLMPITRAHALEQEALHRMRGTVDEVRTAGLRLDLVNGRFGALSWVTYQLLGAACLIAAGWAALTGFAPVSAGDVVLLSTYFAVLTSSVIGLFGLAPIITKGLESIRSIGEVLSAPDLERNEGKQAVGTAGHPVNGAVTLRGVGHRYPDSAAPALSGIDLDVRPGETIAFVGPSGSGQRLAIARALVRDPKVLLLDEATSALDSESERLVQEALTRLMRGRTTFVVAHRLATVRGADRVAVLTGGRLAELGTHAELLAAGGLFARLHTLQQV